MKLMAAQQVAAPMVAFSPWPPPPPNDKFLIFTLAVTFITWMHRRHQS